MNAQAQRPRKTTKATPTKALVKRPAAKPAPKGTTQPDGPVDLSARVQAARALGFSRRYLTDASGLAGTTALWRTDRLSPKQATPLAALLTRIESGQVAPPERRVAADGAVPTKAELAHRLDEVAKLLAAGRDEKTIIGMRKALGAALDVLAPRATS